MKKETAIKSVIDFAFTRLGYLEKSKAAYKKNPKIVYELTDGAGRDNYTECWEDTKKSFQGQPWCVNWVYWIFVKTFGVDQAKKLLYIDTWSASDPWTNFYCADWVENWINHDAKYQSSKAQIGDIIYFTKSHTGLVYDLDSKYVYTIEGNTSTTSKKANGTDEVIPNGGGVALKKYVRGEKGIWCYGRPNWSILEDSPEPTSRPVIKRGYKDSEKGGHYCAEMQADFVELDIRDNYGHLLSVDGSCGARSEEAIKNFQRANNLNPDGHCGPITWATIDECIAKRNDRIEITTKANCRKGPGTSYPVIGVLPEGTIYRYTKTENKWYYLPDVDGWVSSKVAKKI